MGREHIEFVFDDAKATIIQRGTERDQPDGERTIPRCVTAFNAITGHKLSNCDGWLFMEVLKKCRSVQGAYKYDDYRDGVGYAALRAEEARMEHEADGIDHTPGPELVKAAAKYHEAIDKGELIVDQDTHLGKLNITLKDPRGCVGAVIEICRHRRSNCDECGIENDVVIENSLLVPKSVEMRNV